MLRDKHKRVKQLVFNNLKNYLPSAMHNTAVELGIGMRGNEQMQAEDSFLGFLLYRAKREEHAYTHLLVGMGCSKKQCHECDALLKLFLGSNYRVITSAAVQPSREKSDCTMKRSLESGNMVGFEIKYAEDATRTEEPPSRKFLFSDDLKNHIKLKNGLGTLPIDRPQFRNNESSEANQSTKPPAPKRQKK